MSTNEKVSALLAGALTLALLVACGSESTDSLTAADASSSPLANRTAPIDTAERAENSALIDYNGVSVVGRNLSRSRLLAGLVASHEASFAGTIADRRMDINIQETSAAHLLAILLDDVPYTATFTAASEQQGARLDTLTLISAAPGASPRRPIQSALATESLDNFEATEPRTTQLLELIRSGDPESIDLAISHVDMTPGGIDLLANLLDEEQPIDIQLAVIQRLDLADEYAAKGMVLDALGSSSDEVVEAALSSVEVWRDASILPRLATVRNHKNPRIKAMAERLTNDLRSYIEPALENNEFDASYSGDELTDSPDTSDLGDQIGEQIPVP